MKKWIALILAVSVLLMSFSALGETATYDFSGEVNLGVEEMPAKNELSQDKAVKSSDQVTLTEKNVTVKTDFGLVFSFDIPEDIYVLTQSYLQSIDLFNLLYPDPAATVQNFIDRGMHLNIFQLTGDAPFDIYCYAYEQDAIGAIIGDAVSLTETDADYIAEYLASQIGVEFTYGMLSDYVWFLGNQINDNGVLWMFTWVNGCMVKVIISAQTEDIGTTAMNLLTGLTITAQ